MQETLRRENWINLFLGAWIFIIPWALGTTTPGYSLTAVTINFWIIGMVIMLSSGAALFKLKLWEEWVNVAAGIWLMGSPAIFNYAEDASLFWNSLLFGLGIFIISATAIPLVQKVIRNKRA